MVGLLYVSFLSKGGNYLPSAEHTSTVTNDYLYSSVDFFFLINHNG